ncbi:MAG: hypothetical protein KC646_09795 [Candidatus Cloacimonetes bacterium]|nr:hypothetical protein [Candidatus Cloacimonadota bacterium]
MKSIEVAKLLNLSFEEFTQIEESIAMVFQLKKDESGDFVYTKDHLTALKDVFENSDMSFDFLKPNKPSKKTVAKEMPTPTQIPIKKKVSAPVFPSMSKSEDTAQSLFPSVEKEVRMPSFRRVDKSGVEQVERELDEASGPVSELWDKLEEQKSYFNSKFEDFKGEELTVVRAENYNLKKQNLQMQKELETLQKIIKNQNDDKQYLIEKLDEKYSIKGLFNWKKDPFLSA